MADGRPFRRRTLLFALALAAVHAARAQPAPADADAYFSAVDLDADGRISLAEFRDHMSRGFRAMDADDNHVLQGDELPAPGAREVRLENYLAALAVQFGRQDRNGDGFLDRSEFIAPPQ